MGKGPWLVTTLETISASDTTIILLSCCAAGKKGCRYKLVKVSTMPVDKRLAYREEIFPSSNTATGICALLKVFRSSSVLMLLSVTMAGVVMVRELSEVASKMLFLIL